MKRAALEKPRTYHQWKQHHDQHLRLDPGKPIICSCDLQVNRFRKGRRRYGCGKPRCYACHGEKLLGIPTHKVRRMYDALKLQED